MLPVEGSKVALFSKWLNETVPLLRKMPPNIRVIWLSQNPILSVFPKELADESAYITLPYIDRYNQIARQVFQ
jgi:hypothetical protein